MSTNPTDWTKEPTYPTLWDAVSGPAAFLLLETGGFLLLETTGKIIL